MLFDTHTHLNDEAFSGEEAEAVERAIAHDVKRMAIVGFDEKTIEKSLELSRDFSEIYSIIGWHPTEAYLYNDKVEEKLIQQLQLPKVVAMGEMGLDYHWDTSLNKLKKMSLEDKCKLQKNLNYQSAFICVMQLRIRTKF